MSEVLTTYLQDHHAGAAAGVDLFERVAEGHGDQDVRAAVARLAEEVRRDKARLEELMAAVGASASTLKDSTARIGEKVGRLKPNEHLASRSPLSDLVELEALAMAVHGKRLGLTALCELDDPRLDRVQVEELLARAAAQADELEALHRGQAHKLLQP